MLAADEDFYKKYGEPLFGSHMLDLSEEPDDENIAICVEYFKRMAPMKIWLEMEIGITGGEEDGVNNEDVDPEKLYTSPEQVYAVYDALSKVGDMFSIAAAFGNVHGVYKPGNVVLSPERLGKHQEYARKMLGSSLPKPIFLVMHGGSGSTDEEIQAAVKNGVVKMNIDSTFGSRMAANMGLTMNDMYILHLCSNALTLNFSRNCINWFSICFPCCCFLSLWPVLELCSRMNAKCS
jgi:fructose-bisphosphate aldolase class II